jgi:hypothetical protein
VQVIAVCWAVGDGVYHGNGGTFAEVVGRLELSAGELGSASFTYGNGEEHHHHHGEEEKRLHVAQWEVTLLTTNQRSFPLRPPTSYIR